MNKINIQDNGELYNLAHEYPGFRPLIMNFITDNAWACRWARNIGDQDTMRERITDSHWAYYWAFVIGDHETMRERITDLKYVSLWNFSIGINADLRHLEIELN